MNGLGKRIYVIYNLTLGNERNGDEPIIPYHSQIKHSSNKFNQQFYNISNIYILNVAALDETIIPSCLHFSMQNIEQSRGLDRASRWSNINVNQ